MEGWTGWLREREAGQVSGRRTEILFTVSAACSVGVCSAQEVSSTVLSEFQFTFIPSCTC